MNPQLKQNRRLLVLTASLNSLQPFSMSTLTERVNADDEGYGEVSPKTIQRDLKLLRQQGAPLLRTGDGYCFREKWQLTLTPLDEEDLFGLGVAVKTAEKQLLPAMREMAAHNLGVQAIASASDGAAKRQLEQIFVHSRGAIAYRNPDAADKLFQAWSETRRVDCDYRNGRDEKSRRQLEPHCLFLYNGNWFTYARDVEQGRLLYFSLARFETVKLRPEAFERDAEAEALVKRGEVFEHSPVLGVVLRLEPRFSAYIRERQWFAGQRLVQDDLGRWSLEIPSAPLYALLCFIFRFKGEVVAESPAALREVVRKSAAKMLRLHEDEGDLAGE